MSILTKGQRERWQWMIDSHSYMGEPIHWKHWHHDQMGDALETIDALEKERDALQLYVNHLVQMQEAATKEFETGEKGRPLITFQNGLLK